MVVLLQCYIKIVIIPAGTFVCVALCVQPSILCYECLYLFDRVNQQGGASKVVFFCVLSILFLLVYAASVK